MNYDDQICKPQNIYMKREQARREEEKIQMFWNKVDYEISKVRRSVRVAVSRQNEINHMLKKEIDSNKKEITDLKRSTGAKMSKMMRDIEFARTHPVIHTIKPKEIIRMYNHIKHEMNCDCECHDVKKMPSREDEIKNVNKYLDTL